MALGGMVAILAVGAVATAEPFCNSPELCHPDWVTPFPYQRNIMVGFDTDPHFWPDHISSPTPDARKALTPSVVHHEGTDDARLYPSDWLSGDVEPPGGGITWWLDADTVTGTDRQGILVLEGEAGSTFTLVWHIDNWDRPFEEKHFFVEAEYYATGNLGQDNLISSSGQIEVLAPHYETLPDGWVRWSSWATLVPNPVWEEMVNEVIFEVPGMLLLDHMHIATECVPEPATLGLLGLGGLMLIRRRRR
ncbi:MAG: hypothetical protein AMK72_01215 [Planctomycetes bacterium SM23_25]|nr:MAG: hypothetical protein AMK72_01215 [Planctomycetes bacterium SM23_25]